MYWVNNINLLINIKINSVKKFIFKKLINLKNYFYLFFLSMCIFTTFQVNNFFYLSTESPDFYHLKNYINYYFGEIEFTGRDLGLVYFNLVSILISIKSDLITNLNQNHFIHNAILTTNYLLYIFGLIGFYKLLILKNFEKNNILLSFCILSFFPPTINMLLTMKPEIFAFSLITWTFYFLENFLVTKKKLYIYFLLLPFTLLISSKGSIFFFCGIIFLFIFIKNYKSFLKIELLYPLIIGLFFFTILNIENITYNNFSIFQHVSSSNSGDYNNVASLRFIYNVNFYYLVTQPFSNFHADSLIGIILLDTFGDYFNFWAFNDESVFVVNSLRLKPFWFITHYSQMASIVLTIAFYGLIIYNFKTDKVNKIYYLSPIFAIFLLILNSFGIPIQNYNPVTSDTFKTHYYSFLLAISFVFIVLNLIKKGLIYKLFVFIVIFSSTFYLYGFPKNFNPILNEYFEAKNSTAVFCKFNSKILSGFETENCENIVYQTCSISMIINNTDSLDNNRKFLPNYKYFFPISLTDKNGIEVNARNKSECFEYLSLGFLPKQPLQILKKLSLVNLILFGFMILSVIFSHFYIRKKE